jgi:NADPH:quinone reductase-like Zn-dependent oxidoreductase
MMLHHRSDLPGNNPATPSHAKLAPASSIFLRPPSIAADIPDRSEDFVQRAAGVSAVFDPMGGGNWMRSYRALGKGGRFMGYIFDGNTAKRFHQIVLWLGSAAKHFQSGQRTNLQRACPHTASRPMKQGRSQENMSAPVQRNTVRDASAHPQKRHHRREYGPALHSPQARESHPQ